MSGESDWKTRLAAYFREPERAWERPDERQVVKLGSVFAVANQRHGLDREALIEAVIHSVGRREPAEQQPIYLSNLGGCGSHWISRMMAQAAALVDVGEVYVPVPWYTTMLDLPRDTAARILDGIELVHGLLYNGTPAGFASARIINSAHGYEKICFHRGLRPRARIVHLIRDPRDRTMSVSFRKREFRDYEATGVDDRDYFMSKAIRSLSAWRKYDALEKGADAEIRYEEFRANAADELAKLLSMLELTAARPLVDAVTYRNSPEFLRSAEARNENRGNLDQGGIAKSWRELPATLRRELHSTVAPALLGQQYQLCDCFPEIDVAELRDRDGLAEALCQIDEGDAHIDFKYHDNDDWIPMAQVDPEHVARVRIRPVGRTVPKKLLDHLRPWITDVCAAGIHGFGNRSLEQLGRLPAVVCMDLARTAVAPPLRLDIYPLLRMLNLSGTKVGEFTQSGITVINDY